jgi:MFS family permease
MASLSPASLERGRRSFFVFNALNSASFVLLSGSFVTLYALSLGASNAMVGLLNAFGYGTFFFLPLGKRIVQRRSILRVFGLAWFWRFVAASPALLAPLFVAQGMEGVGFALILVGIALFNMLRGVGLIGNNPVLANLADGGAEGKRADRGAFLVNVSIVASLAGMATNLVIALVIGSVAPPWVFAAAMGIGIALGIVGSLVLLARVPEPEGYRPEKGGSLAKSAREAFRERPFRAFMEALFLLSLVTGMARTFLPVYAKDVFAQGDDIIMAYALVASVGSLAMGLLTRLLVDRLGAKPLYVVFTAFTALSLAPLALAPGPVGLLALPIWAILLLGFVNFLSSFGIAGEENAGQTYFFSLVKPERTLDLGVVYFLVYGLGGTIGAGAGGLALDGLGALGLGHAGAFRVFFAVLLLVLVWVLARSPALVRLGSATLRESLGVMLSIRDLRAFNLLARLDRSADPAEEVDLIRGIGSGAAGGASGQAQAGLLAYLGSPRFDVRLEALLAIENMGELGEDGVLALAAEVEKQPYTTAYLAARILGKSCPESLRARVIPVMRKAAAAADYMLQASAMVALARLGDRESVPTIEDSIASSRVPRVRISAAYALEILGSRVSMPALLSCLRRERDPAFVSDELLLSIASIAGIMPRFYGLYQTFLEDETAAIAALGDLAADAFGDGAEPACAGSAPRATFDSALRDLLADPSVGAPMGALLLSRGAARAGESWSSDLALAEAAVDPGLGYRGLRFLIAAYVLLRP